MFDIFSYIVGNAYGKVKIFKISPNKTLEGLIGGAIVSFVFGLAFSHFVGIFIYNPSTNFSASNAAIQPDPADVTACL